MLRELTLVRVSDGVGTADVAIFPDGTSVLHWRLGPATTEVHPSVVELKFALEGGGAYVLVDPSAAEPLYPTEEEQRRHRRNFLEYAVSNNWSSLEQQAELATMQRNDEPPIHTELDAPAPVPEELAPLPVPAGKEPDGDSGSS